MLYCYWFTLWIAHIFNLSTTRNNNEPDYKEKKKYSRIRHYEKCQLFHVHTTMPVFFGENCTRIFRMTTKLHNILPMNTYFYMSVFQHLIIIIMHLHLLKSALQIAGTSVNLEKCPFQYTAAVCVYMNVCFIISLTLMLISPHPIEQICFSFFFLSLYMSMYAVFSDIKCGCFVYFLLLPFFSLVFHSIRNDSIKLHWLNACYYLVFICYLLILIFSLLLLSTPNMYLCSFVVVVVVVVAVVAFS